MSSTGTGVDPAAGAQKFVAVENFTALKSSRSRKILLVVLPQEGEVRDRVTYKFYKNPVVKYMPLGVLSLAACLRRHDVSVLDASSKGMTLEETIDEIEKVQPEILGLSVVTYRAWAMTEVLRRTSCPIKVVGGPHATANAPTILRQGARAVFIGDAEETFPRWLEEGCPEGIFTGQPVNYNALPLPARDLVSLEDYRIKPNQDLLFDVGSLRLPMFSSKGCPFKCNYCDVQQKTFNWKSPDKVLEEFHALTELGVTSIHILDDCFNVKRDRVKDICDLFVNAGISIDWSARATIETREFLIEALAKAGCRRLHVGIEHLDDHVLVYFKKQQRYKHIEQFCRNCNRYGVHILGYFILGAPEETREYRERLPEMIRELGIAIPYFNVLSPLADTAYYTELLETGRLKTDFWKEYIENPTKDFIMPTAREEELEVEIEDTVKRLIEEFKTNSEKDIVLTRDVIARREAAAAVPHGGASRSTAAVERKLEPALVTNESVRGEFL